MVKRKFSINLLDLIVAIVLILGVVTAVVGWNNKLFLGDHRMLVTIEINDKQSIKNIMSVVERIDGKQVFYSGTKDLVLQKSHSIYYDTDGSASRLDVVLEGLGDISDGNSIFNGQRIYNNQKTEIRSDYYLQGVIVDFRYED